MCYACKRDSSLLVYLWGRTGDWIDCLNPLQSLRPPPPPIFYVPRALPGPFQGTISISHDLRPWLSTARINQYTTCGTVAVQCHTEHRLAACRLLFLVRLLEGKNLGLEKRTARKVGADTERTCSRYSGPGARCCPRPSCTIWELSIGRPKAWYGLAVYNFAPSYACISLHVSTILPEYAITLLGPDAATQYTIYTSKMVTKQMIPMRAWKLRSHC